MSPMHMTWTLSGTKDSHSRLCEVEDAMNQSNITKNVLQYAPRHGAQYEAAWVDCWTHAKLLLTSSQEPDADLAKKLYQGLKAWGMARTGIAPCQDLLRLLEQAWPSIKRLHGIDLDTLGQKNHADLAQAYDVLLGVTRAGLITGASKALLLIWGGLPAFDARVRANARASRSSSGRQIWRFGKACTRLRGIEFANAALGLAMEYQSTVKPDSLVSRVDTHGRRLDRALHFAPIEV